MQDKKQINIEIGARIKEEREKAGLTQERFSELIGLGTKSVSAFERGTVGISFTTLKKICQVLSISSDQILFGPKEQNENDLSELSKRLERLSPKQYTIAEEVILKLLEAFSLNE
ncbi:MAG: helix-turn-helix transcriptional regulator [Clostridiales bacterium]|nr:helix-turn-helix transcriptional regulator [Clostridiales bacterium]